MKSYKDVLSKTSPEYTPWYIVPANREWFRDLVISSVLIESLEGLKMENPGLKENLEGVVFV